jgi:erythromycin esterase
VRRRAWRVTAALAVVLATAVTACACGQPAAPDWIAERAAPLVTADPAAPLDDLETLRRAVGDAQVVGLGEAVHGAAELTTLKHRALRMLVERMGFRTLAWEEDWTTGLLIDEYIRTGAGDLSALMQRMSPQYQSGEVADVLVWLRAINTGRADPVRFVGVEYYLTGPEASDAVAAHVGATAPDRLADLRRDLDLVRRVTPTVFEHIGWFTALTDMTLYLDAARRVHDLVAGLPHPPGDRPHAVALHHARQIRSFYEHFALSDAEALVYRDARTAENLAWWQELTGDRVAYWAAVAHTADAPGLRIAVPPEPDMAFPSAGSYLRDRYGLRYLSVAFTLDHGTVGLGSGETTELAPVGSDRFEHPLGQAGLDRFTLDLREPAPPSVRAWLDAPIRARGLPIAAPTPP